MNKHPFIEEHISDLRESIELWGLDSVKREQASYIRGLVHGLLLANIITEDEADNYINIIRDMLKRKNKDV